jgi:drug/metabolite transporter superfamily protein YnfA
VRGRPGRFLHPPAGARRRDQVGVRVAVPSAYGGVFVVGSLAWGVVADRFRPDRWDPTGAVICLIGAMTIIYARRGD